MSIAHRIRVALQETHVRLEGTPLAAELVRGSISRAAYVRLLKQLLPLHVAFERAAALNPCLPGLFIPSVMCREDALRRDLDALSAENEPEDSIDWAQGLTPHLAEWKDSWALAGPLYVLEGSRMGSMMIAGALARALGVPVQPGTGLDYHLEGSAERPHVWRRFKEALDAVAPSGAAADEIVEAAVVTMDAMLHLYETESQRCEVLAR